MTILKSKAFWCFTSVSSGIGGAVAYDRYEARRIKNEFMKEAAIYGSQPLYPHQSPRLLSFFLLSPTADIHRATLSLLKDQVLDLLTAAGIDYKWILKVEGEEAKRMWDEAAREMNKPEFMIDGNSLDRNDLYLHLMKPIINSNFTEEDDPAGLWKILKEKYTKGGVEGVFGEVVLFDQFTFDRFKSDIEEIKTNDIEPVENLKTDQWWWQRWFSSNSNSQKQPQPVKHQINLFLISCELSQSPLRRLQRFLFGQRDLTRSMAESVMTCIRESKE